MKRSMHAVFLSIVLVTLLSHPGRAQHTADVTTFTPPVSPRTTYNFNPAWQFIREDVAQAADPQFDDSTWTTVSTPHTWNDVDSYRSFISHSGGDRNAYAGIGWYRKHFRLPMSARDGKVFLEFEGLKQAGRFFVNGKPVGKSENGVTACGLDITDFVTFGDAENVLAVKVDNSNDYKEEATGVGFQWMGRAFNPNFGGLNRNVRLHLTGKLYQTLPLYENLQTTGVYVYAKDINLAAHTAEIHVESQVRNESGNSAEITLSAIVIDGGGKVCARFEGDTSDLVPGQTETLTAAGPLTRTRFWDVDDPYLYDVYSILSTDGKVVDVTRVKTGFRKTEFRGGAGTGGVYLNDRFIWLTGYAQRSVNDWAGLGQAYPDWMHDENARLVRASRANYIRWMHIAPQAADVRSCDKYGIVQVCPAGDKEKDPVLDTRNSTRVANRQWAQRAEVMRNTIIYFRNSPSILFWEAGNQVVTVPHMEEMVALRTQWDPHGGRVMGTRHGADSRAAAAINSICEYYGVMVGQDRRTDSLPTPAAIFRGYSAERRDRAPLIETEDFRDEALRSIWDDVSPPHFGFKKGPQDTYAWNSETFALATARRYHEYAINRIDNPDPAHSKWSGYASIYWSDSNADGRQQSSAVLRVSGKVDGMRLPKQAFHAHRVMQNPEPDLHILGHWTYPADTKKTLSVIASHCDTVELFVNGLSLGKNDAPDSGFIYAFPDVVFAPGTIKAVALQHGKIVAQHEIRTAGDPAALKLTVRTSPAGLLADGSDVALIDFEVVDAQGLRCPTDETRVDFTVTGPVIWRGGINSALPNSTNNLYLNTECGINRVAIRSTLTPGLITLTAVRAGLPPATVQIASNPVNITDGLMPVAQARDTAAAACDRLRCEGRENPWGVDSRQPRLSWILKAHNPGTRGVTQTAYRVLAASSLDLLARDQGDLWDSDKVTSEATNQILYAGKALKSSGQVWWKVRIWDQMNAQSSWSEPAQWTMGLLETKDWTGRWIGMTGSGESDANEPASLLLRREFRVGEHLTRATVHVTGMAQYEMSINGRKVGQDLITPGWTDYRKTVLYNTYDVTALLQPGANAAGLILGNGFYRITGGRYTKLTGVFGPKKAIAHLCLDYADGHSEILGTDQTWQVHAGPITFSCVYGGEDRDARLEQTGWDRPGFTHAWPAAKVTTGPGGTLRGLSYAASPVRPFDVLKPVAVNALSKTRVVYDLGQNVSLIPRITVTGPAGSSVRLIPSELLHENGEINDTMCGGKSYWTYTLAGRDKETWFPQFFYRGARYLQVDLSSPDGQALPVIESLEGVVVHSAAQPIGTFACSNDLFNRIFRLIRWAQRSNLFSVITDCPHREKLGWLEQYHLNGPSLRYGFDLTGLFNKSMTDMADAQLDNGLVPDIAPEYVAFSGGFRDSPEWGSAAVLVPQQQYDFTGDTTLLQRYYDNMKRYVDYLTSRADNHIVSHGLGDWYDIGPNAPGYAQLTPKALTATAFYYADVQVLARAANLFGFDRDAGLYDALARDIRTAFNETFYSEQTGQYATGSQCANAIALVMGFCEPAHRERVLQALVDDVEKRGNAVTAGDVGYRYLLRALADGGRSDVIYAMNNQSEKPGYGYQLKKGATSLTEAWDGGSSQNHFMLGHIMEWFYHDLAGIQCDPAAPGFKKIVIKPSPVGDLTFARASYDSIQGRISVHWSRTDRQFTLNVTIPANTTATVTVPSSGPDQVTEGGCLAAAAPGVTFIKKDGNTIVFAVTSGTYTFESVYEQK
ncbi:MAG: family 78 glycoside hydrolase catalytic domain [Phycisphaerae bacterium]|nr:family 78 glycoside hydrolase catalytic domain [Phycisphaerae bacterium]